MQPHHDQDTTTLSPHREEAQPTPVLSLDEWVGRTIAGKYKIEGMLGKGGMSAVYKATHVIMGKTFAVKIMHKHMVTDTNALVRFKQEATAAGSLSHPNIITVHDCSVESDSPFQVIDYLEGRSLMDDIKKDGGIEAERALDIFIQACSALAHAHEKGVIHRDLKPSNIMLIEKDGSKDFVKLVDFGIAKILPQEGEMVQQLTQTGEIFGSPLYMSPEQCLGHKLDARSDLYSMGCLMYETLTGRPPLVGAQVFATIQKHIDETPKPLKEELPASKLINALDGIVTKTLAKQPEQRHQSARELLNELEALKKGEKTGVFTAMSRSAQLAKIRMTPWLKRTPIALLLGFTVTAILLLSVLSYNVQMLNAVPNYKALTWPSFAAEAETWDFNRTNNNPAMAFATIAFHQLERRAIDSKNAVASPLEAARSILSLIAPFAMSGNYEAGAREAEKLEQKVREIETQNSKFDMLELMPPGTTRPVASQRLVFVADSCYLAGDYERATFFYERAMFQLGGLAQYLNKRFNMKLGDCALHKKPPAYALANSYFLKAASNDEDAKKYDKKMFEIKDHIFSSDRATWMSKVGDTLMQLGEYRQATWAFQGAATEWSKDPESMGLEAQSYYRLGQCLAKLGEMKDSEAALNKAIDILSSDALAKIDHDKSKHGFAAVQDLPAVYKELASVLRQDGKFVESLKAQWTAVSTQQSLGRR